MEWGRWVCMAGGDVEWLDRGLQTEFISTSQEAVATGQDVDRGAIGRLEFVVWSPEICGM